MSETGDWNIEKKNEQQARPRRRYQGKRVIGRNGGGQTKKPAAFAAYRRRKLTRQELLILLIPAVAAVIVALVNIVLTRDAMRYPLGEGATQFYIGQAYPAAEGTVLRRTHDDKTKVMVDGKSFDTSTLPYYYCDKRTVVFPEHVVYMDPRNNDSKRINYFSEIVSDEQGGVMVRSDGRSIFLNHGFLYDGGDLYLFLEPVTVEVNGYRFDLPTLSYVEAVYTGEIMVFNFETRETWMEPPVTEVTAKPEDGSYTISLLNDSVTLPGGGKRLLFSRPENLKPIE